MTKARIPTSPTAGRPPGCRSGRGTALRAAGALLLAAWCAGAVAHGLRVSVQADGPTVRGQAFYADGTPAAGNRVSFHAPPEGRETVATTTDAEGRFRVQIPGGGEVRVVVEGEEGHRAETRVTLPAGASGPSAAGEAVAPDTADAPDDAALRAAIREELAPLREQIDRLDQRVRLADAIGGIGLLVGLAGGYALLRARRRT